MTNNANLIKMGCNWIKIKKVKGKIVKYAFYHLKCGVG